MTAPAAAPTTDAGRTPGQPPTASAVAAAEAATAVLPLGAAVTVGQPGTDPEAARLDGAAVTAPLTGSTAGVLVIVVGQDLVTALRAGPLGQLDLIAAVAPAIQAAAVALGSTAGRPREVPVAEAVAELTARPGTPVVVPLLAEGVPHAAVAISVPDAPAPAPVRTPAARPGLELLHGVEMEVTVELGRTRMTVRELLSLTAGSVIELDRAAGSPADLLVNGRLIARGEVVVVDENFGLRLVEILAPGQPAEEWA